MIAYIGIGSNMGNREEWIRKAVKSLGEIERKTRVLRVSPLYETDPEIQGNISPEEKDPENIHPFLNAVAEIETPIEPEKLLDELLKIEREMGRERTKIEDEGTPGIYRPFLSRNIDLDILFYGKQIYRSNRLIIPHPRAHRRSFMMIPMLQVNANFVHPILKQTIAEICDEPLKPSGIRIYKRWQDVNQNQ